MLEFPISVFNPTGQPMHEMAFSCRLGSTLLTALLVSTPAPAQIVTDGSVGIKDALNGANITIGSELGTRTGDNLFHSFERFGIGTGQRATFTGPDTIRNVISRVTGGEVSNIDGTLASSVGQADLYFINPAGVMFGPNARLEVPASFHVSTAHELRFSDGVSFSALDQTGSGLTAAAPEAFGFLDRPARGISVDRSQLRLNPGRTLSLVGGDLMIDAGPAGSLRTARGVVQLVSTAASGTVRIADAATTGGKRGSTHITQTVDNTTTFGAVDVSGNGGGTIRIRGGQINFDGALIFADNNGDRDSTGGIDIQAVEMTMRGGNITTDSSDAGSGGDIGIVAGELSVLDGAVLGSGNRKGTGNSGLITINADHLIVAGGSSASSNIASYVAGSGDSGGISITAKDLQLQPWGFIQTNTEVGSSGNSGNISIKTNSLRMFGDKRPSAISTQTKSSGNAGRVDITAKEIILDGQASIDSSAPGTGTRGNAGTVVVETDFLKASGKVAGFSPTIATGTDKSGTIGTVQIKAGSIFLADGANIRAVGTSVEQDAGSGGAIAIEVTDILSLKNDSRIITETVSADGGIIDLKVGRLLDMDFSKISTSVDINKGNGGNINITRRPNPNGTTRSDLSIALNRSVILAQADQGKGGDITINAGQVFKSSDSQIDATSVRGESGRIDINASITDTMSNLVLLPSVFFEASAILPTACSGRGSQPTNSLIAGGRGGLPPDPSAPLFSMASPEESNRHGTGPTSQAASIRNQDLDSLQRDRIVVAAGTFRTGCD